MVSSTTILKAIAVKAGLDDSEVAMAIYTIPVFNITYIINGVPEVVQVSPGQTTLKTDVTAPSGFEFKGWTTTEFTGLKDPTDVVIKSGKIDVYKNITLYSVFGMQGPVFYEKHTANDGLNGDFLIINETSGKAFDGSMSNLNGMYNSVDVTIVNNKIEGTDNIKNYCFTINSSENIGYSGGIKCTVKSKSGYYIGRTSSSHQGVDYSTSSEYENEINIVDGDAAIVCYNQMSSPMYLRFNNSYDMFGYYNGAFQKDIQLYKKVVLEPSDHRFCIRMEVMDNNTIVSGNVVKDNVFINGTVTVADGAMLTVNGEILNTNAEYADLVMEDGSQLIHNHAGVMATVQQTIERPEVWGADISGWQIISSPIVNASVTNFTSGDAEDYDLYRWVPENQSNGVYEPWYNQKNHTDFVTLENGDGYLVSYKTSEIFNNRGELNCGNTWHFALSKYDDNNPLSSYTLLGNPFAYDINWSDMQDVNIYNDGYAVVVNGAFSYTVDGIIPVAEGFMIKALSSDAVLKYTKGTAKRDTDYIKKINVIVEDNTGTDNAVIVMNNGDGGFEKLANVNDDISLVFITSDNNRYGIYSCSEDVTSIPVGFKANTIGEFTLRVEAEGEFDNIYLIDNSTGNKVNMLMEDSYEFVGMPNGDVNRFSLVFSSNETANETEKFAYTTDNSIIIEKVNGIGEVKVMDITGRIMMTESVLSGSEINVDILNTGIYILQMVDESGIKTQKVLVK